MSSVAPTDAGSTDDKLFAVCAAERRIIVTLDLDFAKPLHVDPRGTAGIAVLRLPKDHGPTDVIAAVDALSDAATDRDISDEPAIVFSRPAIRSSNWEST